MEHVVFFPAQDGAPAFRRVASLADAVQLVEHLRNTEGIDAVSCHALTEVPLAFRTYYRVEVPGLEGPGGDAPPPAEQPAAEPFAAADVPAPVPLAEPADPTAPALAATGSSPEGVNSLGFFA